jgi:3-dehydroquinate dehydratase
MYTMASINYIVIDIMIIIILTSSRPKSNICLDYVQCTHTNVSLFDAIQGGSVPGARVRVYRALVGLNKIYITTCTVRK